MALDSPIWSALTTVHRPLALSNGLAVRYPSDISPLAALLEPTAPAFADLAGLVGPEESVALFTTAPVEPPPQWQIMRTRWIEQMVCVERTEPSAVSLLELGEADVPEMLALTAATEPGPFRPRTIKMGRYLGIRSADGRLIAMAGERLRLEGHTEISAVCTDPEFRGRGHARSLVAALTSGAQRAGRVPFLHVKGENSSAKKLYEQLGFRVRCDICLTVIAMQ
jgi:predicted GNAT family acetyltransferase